MKYVVNYKLDKTAKKNLEKKAAKALAKSEKAEKLPDDSDCVEYTNKDDAAAFYDEVKKAKTSKGFYTVHECHADENGVCKLLDKEEW